MKQLYFTSVLLILAGCAGTNTSYQLYPDEYVSDVKYDSIYYYGYNHGCDSVLDKIGMDGYNYLKDNTFINTETRYSDGWESGYQACSSGERKVIEL